MDPSWREIRLRRNAKMAEIAKDKLKSAEFFIANGIRTPKTFAYSKEKFDALMAEFGEVVFKPITGWGGQDVFLLQKGEPLPEHLDLEYFLIQQRIETAFLDERTFDLRFLVQKEEGKHVIVGYYARVSRQGSFVTNLGREGRADDANQVLELFFQEQAAQALKFAIDLAELCTEKLSQKTDFLEAGLDISIDKNGQPYMIEINSRPGCLGYKILAIDAEDSHYGSISLLYPESLKEKNLQTLERIRRNRLQSV